MPETQQRSAARGCRLIAAAVVAAIGWFCLLGLRVALGPHIHMAWRIGYGLAALLFFSFAAWLAFGAFRLHRVGLVWGISGLFLGAIAGVGAGVGLLYLLSPNWVIYGPLLAAPIGISIGAAAGSWIAMRLRKHSSADSSVPVQSIAASDPPVAESAGRAEFERQFWPSQREWRQLIATVLAIAVFVCVATAVPYIQCNVYPFFEPGADNLVGPIRAVLLGIPLGLLAGLVLGCLQWKGYWPSWIGGLLTVLAIVITILMFARS